MWFCRLSPETRGFLPGTPRNRRPSRVPSDPRSHRSQVFEKSPEAVNLRTVFGAVSRKQRRGRMPTHRYAWQASMHGNTRARTRLSLINGKRDMRQGQQGRFDSREIHSNRPKKVETPHAVQKKRGGTALSAIPPLFGFNAPTGASSSSLIPDCTAAAGTCDASCTQTESNTPRVPCRPCYAPPSSSRS